MMVVFLHYSREIILECPLFVVKQLLLGTLSTHEKPKQMSRLSKMHLVQFITKDIEENTLVLYLEEINRNQVQIPTTGFVQKLFVR